MTSVTFELRNDKKKNLDPETLRRVLFCSWFFKITLYSEQVKRKKEKGRHFNRIYLRISPIPSLNFPPSAPVTLSAAFKGRQLFDVKRPMCCLINDRGRRPEGWLAINAEAPGDVGKKTVLNRSFGFSRDCRCSRIAYGNRSRPPLMTFTIPVPRSSSGNEFTSCEPYSWRSSAQCVSSIGPV